MFVINSNLWYPCGQDVEILSKELIADNPWRDFPSLCVWVVFSRNIWASSYKAEKNNEYIEQQNGNLKWSDSLK